MLNLARATRKLTQGQPPAEMTLRLQRAEDGAGATMEEAAPAAGPEEAAPAAAPIDPYAIARRVYDLMRQELAVERDRRARTSV